MKRSKSAISRFKVLLAYLLLVGVSAAARPDAAFAIPIEWPLKNMASGAAVNDLTVGFDKPLNVDPADTTFKKNWPKLGPEGSTSGSNTADSISADKMTATFNANNLPGSSVVSGGKLTLFFEAPSGTSVVKGTSRFTRDGTEIGESVGMVGRAPNLFFVFQPSTQQFLGFAQLANPESFDVTYSNIQLFRNNQIASFNIDQFLTPTGELVTGLPTSTTLGPGQVSDPLSFGPIDPSGYELALADAAATSTPNDLFRFGSADVVPEPSSMVLFGLGGLSLLGYRWRPRQRRA